MQEDCKELKKLESLSFVASDNCCASFLVSNYSPRKEMLQDNRRRYINKVKVKVQTSNKDKVALKKDSKLRSQSDFDAGYKEYENSTRQQKDKQRFSALDTTSLRENKMRCFSC